MRAYIISQGISDDEKTRFLSNFHHHSEMNTEVPKHHLYFRKVIPYGKHVYIVLNFQQHQIEY